MANLKKNESTFIDGPDNVFESSDAFQERLKRIDAWQKKHDAASPSWRKMRSRNRYILAGICIVLFAMILILIMK